MPVMVPDGSFDVSPVRKRTDESGALMVELVAPVQSAMPFTLADSRLMTQTLVGVLTVLRTASGAPKKQLVDVQVLRLPVCVDVVGPRVAMLAAQEVMEEVCE